MNYTLIIPAAGQGKRMGAGKNKLFLEVNEEPIIVHTLKQFQQDVLCEEIVLVINKEEEAIFSSFLAMYGLHKKIVFVQGGEERQESVYNGVEYAKHAEYIVVHDGARPFLTTELTHSVLQAATECDAAICAVPVKDTIKRVQNGVVQETVERATLWSVQTPQVFKAPLLREAHEWARREGFLGTDDASLVEQLGKPVKVVMGDYCNIKVTTPEDLMLAESFLMKR